MTVGVMLAALAFTGVAGEGSCIAPAICEAPAAEFSNVMPVPSRQQWVSSGGYCGSVSISSIMLSYGAYVSQDVVRKAGGAGTHGVEIGTIEIEGALDTLKFAYESWDHDGQPRPQGPSYLSWLKGQLVAGHPVVWFIMCKGDSHTAQGQTWDHIEPVWGIFSNRSLSDSTVYDDDVIVHGSDYGASMLVEAPRLYRPLGSLLDNTDMDGNCADAQPQWGKNEFYPCVPYERSFGTAITGPAESQQSLPVSLAIDCFAEPNFVWNGETPVDMKATVTIGSLEPGTLYNVYRYDHYKDVPTDGEFETSAYAHRYSFKATSSEYSFVDDVPVLSSGMAYYKAAAARSFV